MNIDTLNAIGDLIIKFVSTLGVPVTVMIWFMIVAHKDSENSTKAINKLTTMIETFINDFKNK